MAYWCARMIAQMFYDIIEIIAMFPAPRLYERAVGIAES